MYNILVCDDEKDIVSALTIYLTTAGYQVFPAYDWTCFAGRTSTWSCWTS